MIDACRKPVVWDAEGNAEMLCDAAKPCPYHDRNGLTAEQRAEWRRTWTTQYLRHG